MHWDNAEYLSDAPLVASLPYLHFHFETELFYFITQSWLYSCTLQGNPLDFSLWFSLARWVVLVLASLITHFGFPLQVSCTVCIDSKVALTDLSLDISSSPDVISSLSLALKE